jgi:hypothetical protein
MLCPVAVGLAALVLLDRYFFGRYVDTVRAMPRSLIQFAIG